MNVDPQGDLDDWRINGWKKLRSVTLDPLTALILVVFSVLIFLFYTTNFRRELENFFHDTRIWLMPEPSTSDAIIVIEIDDASIATLETDPIRLRRDASKMPYLSTRNLTIVSGILANTEARVIALLFPDRGMPVNDPDVSEIIDIARFDPRFVIGLSGYHQAIPNLNRLPQTLEVIADQVAATETFRSRSNAIVRSMPYLSYRGLRESLNLPSKIAKMQNPEFATSGGSYLIKHHQPSHYPRVKIEDLIKRPDEFIDRFKGKIAIVGYTVPRSVGIQTTEQSFANTPLTGYAPTNLSGVSTTWLMANAAENLVLDEQLRSAPGFVTLTQTVAVAAICGLSWSMGSLTAAGVTAFVWVILLLVHAMIYRWLSLSIPLADTFLTTALLSLVAASRTLKRDLKLIAEQEVTTEGKLEIVKFQSLFLTGFAAWILKTSDTISSLVKSSRSHAPNTAQNTELFNRVFLATSDLIEYASGISQLSQTDANAEKPLSREPLDLEITLKGILRRFDAKAAAKQMNFVVQIDQDARILRSNLQFVDAIIYNLISNAVKYGNPGTDIVIHISKTAAGATSISVCDKGPGIPEDLRERIFERFYRINDERLYSAKGTGVGLYLCKYFAEALGGRIELHSEIGVGSEFRAVIP